MTPLLALLCYLIGLAAGILVCRVLAAHEPPMVAAPFLALPAACTVERCQKIETDSCVYHSGTGFVALTWCHRVDLP